MLRITTWRPTGPARNDVTQSMVIQTANEMCAALEKVPGAGKVRWYYGNGGIVTIGEPDNYGVADSILTSPAAQSAVARFLGLGFGIAEDQFLLEAARVMPFIEAQQAVEAGLTR